MMMLLMTMEHCHRFIGSTHRMKQMSILATLARVVTRIVGLLTAVEQNHHSRCHLCRVNACEVVVITANKHSLMEAILALQDREQVSLTHKSM